MRVKNKAKILKDLGIKDNGNKKFLCQCECGKEFEVWGSTYYKENWGGHCGCKNHRLKGTRIYSIWENMKSRCNNPNNPNYSRYGKRGVRVCNEWNNFIGFYNWAIANGYNDDLTIDRVDFNGNYEPSNCRWVGFDVQSRNKRNNVLLEINGETKCLKDWCTYLGVDYKNFHRKLKKENVGAMEYLKRKIERVKAND